MKTFLYLLSALVVVTVWVLANSNDDVRIDDATILAHLPSDVDEQNGMRAIRHLIDSDDRPLKEIDVDHGELPSGIEDLLGEYLKDMPRDYFSGDPLRYDSSAEWFYATGANFNLDGGSRAGFYQEACKLDDGCWNNPTIPMIPIVTDKKAEG